MLKWVISQESIVEFQLNTDHNVQGTQDFAAEVEAGVRASLGHWESRLTRIEAHLSDANAGKSGDADKHCELEARPAGRPPLSVEDSAETYAQAIHGATLKLKHALEHAFGKLDSARHGDSPRS